MTAMLDTDKVFSGSIPGSYDRYMVPLIFQPYAEDLAQRAATLSPVAVLETAAGSGVVTRALAPRLAPHATYVVTDLNQPMVDYASSRQPPEQRIKWRQADALALPFENAAFDLICCQFGALTVVPSKARRIQRHRARRAHDREPQLAATVKALFDAKYGWSDGLIAELTPA